MIQENSKVKEIPAPSTCPSLCVLEKIVHHHPSPCDSDRTYDVPLFIHYRADTDSKFQSLSYKDR